MGLFCCFVLSVTAAVCEVCVPFFGAAVFFTNHKRKTYK